MTAVSRDKARQMPEMTTSDIRYASTSSQNTGIHHYDSYRTEQFSNPYLAMANNPVRYTDPSGMYTHEDYLDEDGGGGGNNDGFGDVHVGMRGWNYYHPSNLASSNSWVNNYGAHNGSFSPYRDGGVTQYYTSSGWRGDATFRWNTDKEAYRIEKSNGVDIYYGAFENVSGLEDGWHSGFEGQGVNDWGVTFINLNTGISSATGFFSGNYGLTSGQVFKYAKRIDGKILSAAEITAANTAQSLRVARLLGRVSLGGAILGTGASVYNIVTDYQSGGWDQVNGWDVSDAAVGTTGIITGVFLAATPIGWGVAIGVGVYFAARLVYDISTDP